MSSSAVASAAGDLSEEPVDLSRTFMALLEDDAEDASRVPAARSHKLERLKKKQQKKQSRAAPEHRSLFDLPYDVVVHILSFLRPSDVFRLSRTGKSVRDFLSREEAVVARAITARRYASLARCFRLPAHMRDINPALQAWLQEPDRQELMAIHKKPYQHVPSPDPALVCTCLTCLLRWNSLCLAVDFARWQADLDRGEPIPTIPRGAAPAWNQALLARHEAVVARAMDSPYWHAAVLEAHLASTVRSIARHSANRGNRRRRFRMDAADERAGTDAFLERSGPPTLDFPFHRDNYYMLEAFLPSRGWNQDEGRWMYAPADQHDRDLQFVERWGQIRRGLAEKREAERKAREAADASAETEEKRQDGVTGTGPLLSTTSPGANPGNQ